MEPGIGAGGGGRERFARRRGEAHLPQLPGSGPVPPREGARRKDSGGKILIRPEEPEEETAVLAEPVWPAHLGDQIDSTDPDREVVGGPGLHGHVLEKVETIVGAAAPRERDLGHPFPFGRVRRFHDPDLSPLSSLPVALPPRGFAACDLLKAAVHDQIRRDRRNRHPWHHHHAARPDELH